MDYGVVNSLSSPIPLPWEHWSPNFDAKKNTPIRICFPYFQEYFDTDKETSTFWFIHFRVQEWVQGNCHLFGSAPSSMVETNLSYLNIRQVKALATSQFPDLEDTPYSNSLLDIEGCRQNVSFQIRQSCLRGSYLTTRQVMTNDCNRTFSRKETGEKKVPFLGTVGL